LPISVSERFRMDLVADGLAGPDLDGRTTGGPGVHGLRRRRNNNIWRRRQTVLSAGCSCRLTHTDSLFHCSATEAVLGVSPTLYANPAGKEVEFRRTATTGDFTGPRLPEESINFRLPGTLGKQPRPPPDNSEFTSTKFNSPLGNGVGRRLSAQTSMPNSVIPIRIAVSLRRPSPKARAGVRAIAWSGPGSGSSSGWR
jgi:hypothetical protein